MLIIGGIALATLLFVGVAVRTEERVPLWGTLLLVVVWHLIWLPVVQLELDATRGKGTYGSDADYYLTEMNKLLASGPGARSHPRAHGHGYVYYGAAVLATSPSRSIVWVKLANICVLILCLSLAYRLMRERNVRPAYGRFFVMLLGLNGIVTWMVLRNLKDTLFVTGAFLQIVFLYSILYRDGGFKYLRLILCFAATIVFGWLLTTLRPWGMFFALFATFSVLLGALAQRHLRWTQAFLLFVVILVFCSVSQDWLLQKWAHYLQARTLFTEASVFLPRGSLLAQVVVPPVRFLTGPGFLRAICGSEAFVVTSTTGNILVAMGSLMWWGLLPLLVMSALRPLTAALKDSALIGPGLSLLLVYAYMYGGTADTRTRAVFYLLSAPLIAGYVEDLSRRSPAAQGNRRMIYSGLLTAVFVLGCAFSYRTVL